MKKILLIQLTVIVLVITGSVFSISGLFLSFLSCATAIGIGLFFWNRLLTNQRFGNTLLFISSSLLGLQLVTYSIKFEHHEKLMLTTVLLAFGSLIPLYLYLKLTKSAELKSKANQLLWYNYIFGNFLFLLYLHDKMDWKF